MCISFELVTPFWGIKNKKMIQGMNTDLNKGLVFIYNENSLKHI